jgi:hypothetical protein
MAKEPKKMRSVRLEPHIEQKLSLVAEKLGLNVNAYLVARIGEAVNRDYQVYEIAERQQQAMMAMFEARLDEADKQNLEDQ